jgi:hypothetical protein
VLTAYSSPCEELRLRPAPVPFALGEAVELQHDADVITSRWSRARVQAT